MSRFARGRRYDERDRRTAESAAVKVTLDRRGDLAIDDAVETAMVRYQAAFADYRDLVDKNAELHMTGYKLSPRARLEEELAYDELDSARHALFTAAAVAFPTIH